MSEKEKEQATDRLRNRAARGNKLDQQETRFRRSKESYKNDHGIGKDTDANWHRSFAAAYDDASLAVNTSDRLRNLVSKSNMPTRLVLDVFGSANTTSGVPRFRPAVILERRRHERTYTSHSAVTVLSSADPYGCSELRHPRSSSQGRRRWCRARFVHRVLSIVCLQLRDYDSLFERSSICS